MMCYVEKGFSLMSVVIAWALCSGCILLAYDGVRFSFRDVVFAHDRSVAALMLSNAAAEKLNTKEVRLYRQWSRDVATLLPQGKARLDCRVPICEARIRWFDWRAHVMQWGYGVQ